MKKRGSAIVISMLLITAISVIAFGMAKMLFAGSQTIQMYENGSVAYYSAEAGVEEAFLRYRYNQNAQVPFRASDKPWDVNQTDLQFVSDLTNNSSNSNDYLGSSSLPSGADARQINGLRMGYVGTYIKEASLAGSIMYGYGIPDTSKQGWDYDDFKTLTPSFKTNSKYNSVYLQQDDAIKIDMTGFDFTKWSDNLKIYTKFYGKTSTETLDKCRSLLEIKLTVIRKTGIEQEYKGITRPLDSVSCDIANEKTGIVRSSILSINNDTTQGSLAYSVMPIKVVDQAGDNRPTSDDEVRLFIRPLYYNVAVGLINEGCSAGSTDCSSIREIVPGPETYVISNGYYGGIQKTLKAFIDRQSGSLYDLFDYVIYTDK